MSFEVRVPGKWILAGEHAVLRGSPALVFPLKSRSIHLSYRPRDHKTSGGDITLNLSGEHGEELQLLFWGVLEKACELKKVQRSDLAGVVQINSNIPVGAGLGASASLSVAVTQWFRHLKIVSEGEVQEFARTLENLFHGESSGVDIAVAASGEGLRFVRGQSQTTFPQSWNPLCFVSYSGKRGVTVECVRKVKDLIARNPELGNAIDQDMRKAEELAEDSFRTNNISILAQSIDLGFACFQKWGLVDDEMSQHCQMLRDKGAIAVKPTGSGSGGYILSLWTEQPPEELQKKLIACFNS